MFLHVQKSLLGYDVAAESHLRQTRGVIQMIRYVDECVGCSSMGLFCLGASCPNRNVRRFFCDCCQQEAERLFIYNGDELCEYCFGEAVGVEPSELYDDDVLDELHDKFEFEIKEEDNDL